VQPDPEDRLSDDTAKSSVPWLLIAIVIVLVAAGAWYFLREQQPETPAVSSEPAAQPARVVVTAEPPQPPAEDIPAVIVEQPEEFSAVGSVPPPPALSLEQSDDFLRQELGDATGSQELVVALEEDNLVERASSLVDTLSRGLLVHNVLPWPRPTEKFGVIGEKDNLQVDTASYARYDDYAQDIAAVDVATLVTVFHETRPLLEQAYASLGYPAKEFDNAVIRALDRIVATPRIEYAPEVVPSGGIYKFSDPDLEALVPVQKLLLRMGPENAELLRTKARELRRALLNQ